MGTSDTSRTVEGRVVHRAAQLDAQNVDAENLRVELAFSSEQPVRRFFFETGEVGDEILDHDPSSVDLERINAAGPLLLFHDREQWVGKVVAARVDEDRVGRAVVQFHPSRRDLFDDVVAGTRDTVSVGYAVNRMKLERTTEDGPVYRVDSWTPFEISLEPTPADITVGAGRSLANEEIRTEILSPATVADELPNEERGNDVDEKTNVEVSERDLEQARREAREQAKTQEIDRQDAIRKVADQYAKQAPAVAELAREAISQDMTVRQFEAMIAPVLSATPTTRFSETTESSNDIGLTSKERESFSLCRLIAAKAFGHEDAQLIRDAEFELAVSAEAAKHRQTKAPNGGIALPADILSHPVRGNWKRGAAIVGDPRFSRDMTAGSATQGADFIQTDVVGSSLIDFLRDMSALLPRATVLRGLQGNFAAPRTTAGVTGAWVAEGGANEVTPALDQMVLSPRTVIATVDVTRRLLLQTAVDVEAYLRREFGAAFAVTLENGAITDDGGNTNRPEGLLGITGTADHNLGAAGSMTWAHFVGFEGQVALGSALMGDLAYLTNPKVVSDLKTIEKGGVGSGRFIMEDGEANGYPVASTNQVPSNLGGGSESAMIFGNMTDATFGFWEELAVTVDPYTQAANGIVRLTGHMEADFNVRHPESFAVCENIETVL